MSRIGRLLDTSNVRRLVLLAMAALVMLSAHLCTTLVFPAYDELASLRSLAEHRALEHARLTGHLAVSEVVKERFDTLADRVRQEDKDEVALSRFLLDLEGAARHPSISIVNIKPFPIRNDGTYKVYRVKMSVAGKLQDVTRFVSDVTNGDSVVGIESFSLRGVQGIGSVEFAAVLRMIRVTLPAKDGVSQRLRNVVVEAL